MESEFLGWLRPRLSAHPQLRLGPGDDAALLRLADRRDAVVTVDLLNDGVDFELAGIDDPRRIGHKALAVNLSDLAAMAAEPVAAVVALLLPRGASYDPRAGFPLAKTLYEGLLPLAELFGIAIAGGDTNTWNGPLAIGITAIGQTTPRGPLLRSGARPGDRILVTGRFGGSILGRHLDVQPRVREALLLNERYALHAGIDCSDGLARDLWHLCEESGCGAILETANIPIAAAAFELAQSRADGITPLEHALRDGEDFELILAVSPEEAARLLSEQPLQDAQGRAILITDIGEFTGEKTLRSRAADGRLDALATRGYEH